jgi:CheY-like chemotaxis protein
VKLVTEIARILLVDDDPDIREITQITLTDVGGWQTQVAASGAEAIALARSDPPDLILLDVMMPEMDGLETLRLLRSHAETRHIPIVFLTAKVQSADIERYLELGALGVIKKPFDPMTLPEQVANTLQADT